MLNNESVQQILDTTTEEIEQLKNEANEAISKYSEICYEEALKEKNLEVDEANVRKDLRTDSNGFTITSDFKSANPSETKEERYEQKRQSIITQIRSRVANKEISLDSASKARDYFNETYNHSQEKEDIWNDMHR